MNSCDSGMNEGGKITFLFGLNNQMESGYMRIIKEDPVWGKMNLILDLCI